MQRPRFVHSSGFHGGIGAFAVVCFRRALDKAPANDAQSPRIASARPPASRGSTHSGGRARPKRSGAVDAAPSCAPPRSLMSPRTNLAFPAPLVPWRLTTVPDAALRACPTTMGATSHGSWARWGRPSGTGMPKWIGISASVSGAAAAASSTATPQRAGSGADENRRRAGHRASSPSSNSEPLPGRDVERSFATLHTRSPLMGSARARAQSPADYSARQTSFSGL